MNTGFLMLPGTSIFIPRNNLLKAVLAARIIDNRTVKFPKVYGEDFVLNSELTLEIIFKANILETETVDIIEDKDEEENEAPKKGAKKKNEEPAETEEALSETQTFVEMMESTIYRFPITSKINFLDVNDLGLSEENVRIVNSRLIFFNRHLEMCEERRLAMQKIASDMEEESGELREVSDLPTSGGSSKANNRLKEIETSISDDKEKHEGRTKSIAEKINRDEIFFESDNLFYVIDYIKNDSNMSRIVDRSTFSDITSNVFVLLEEITNLLDGNTSYISSSMPSDLSAFSKGTGFVENDESEVVSLRSQSEEEEA